MIQRTLISIAAMSLLTSAMVSCTDNDYDFDEVDLTMGFGSEELTIPLSNSNDLPLEDILELETDGSVRADESTGWDYLFHLAGGEVAAAHPTIAPIVAEATTTTVEYDVTLGGTNAKAHRAASRSVTIAPKVLAEYRYQGEAKDVVSITRATVDPMSMTIDISFPSVMKTCVSTVKTATLSFPDYIKIDKVTGTAATLNGSVITLTDVPTSKNLKLAVTFSAIDFTDYDKGNGSLTLANDRIDISGNIKLGLSFNANLESLEALAGADNLGTIGATLTTDRMTLRTAAGRFDPHIAIDNLGETDVTGVPDFLEDGNVVADLDNPQVVLGVDNDMDIAAYISGDIIASKDGRNTATIHLSNLHIGKQQTSKLCICRKKTTELVATYGDENVYEVSNLNDLVLTIPDHLKFTNVEAKADLSQDTSIEFGKSYTVKPSYEVNAPLAFGKDAVIVYKDTLDGWKEDIDDLRLSDDTYVLVSCDITNRLPVHLTLDVTPIDINGRPISENKIKVEVPTTVIASSDGVTPAVTAITAKVTQLDENAIQELDGMIFTIKGAATHEGDSVSGVTLNAKKHTLRMDNIKATVVGKVIADFN